MGGYFVTQYDYDRGNRLMRILLSEMLLVQRVLSGDFYLFSYVVSELAIYNYEIGCNRHGHLHRMVYSLKNSITSIVHAVAYAEKHHMKFLRKN